MTLRITGGTYRGRRISAPRRPALRPTSDRVRGAIFSILGPGRVEGKRVLDLYAGTGVLGIEALSRGAAWADFVEADDRLARQIKESLAELSLEGRGRAYRTRVEEALDTLPGDYELVFADPPYGMDVGDLLMGPLGKSHLLKDQAVVVVEHRYGARLADEYGRLVQMTQRRYGDTGITIYIAGATDG